MEVKNDKGSEARMNELEDKGKSLGENGLLGGKSVLEAIRDGNFERNRSIVFSKMNDKFPLWYYQPKVVSLYIYTLEV